MAQSAQNLKDKTELAPFLPVKLGPRDYLIDRKPDGTIYLRSPHTLPPYPEKITERLVHWAQKTPDTIYMADRVNNAWRKTTYADTLARVRCIAGARWNSPSFITARMRALSCSTVMSCKGSPSTSRMSAR